MSAPGIAASRPQGKTVHERRWLILAICCMSLFIVSLDVSGLNVALPSMRASLALTSSQLQWVIDAYTLVLASLLMLSGSVSDRIGRKLAFRIGLAVFGAGSIACAFAASGPMLIGARVLQAVGGSMLNPVAMSIIVTTFRDPKERAQAIGFWGIANGVSMALGPLIGGLLVEWSGWRAVFWLNVPVVVAALVLATIYIPEGKAAQVRAFDPVGQLLLVVGLSTLVFAIIEGRGHGWASPLVIGCFVAAAAAVVVFAVAERRVRHPLIDLRFFASRPFSGAVIAAVFGFAANAGFLFVNTLYLQGDRRMSPVMAGLTLLPMAAFSAALAPVAGRMVGTRGSRIPMTLAGGFVAGSGLILTRLAAGTCLPLLLMAYALLGVGMGLLNAPITTSAATGMPRNQSGVAAAVASTGRQIGVALGVAVFGTLTFGASGRDGHAPVAEASHPAWWAMVVCGLAVVAVGLWSTGPAAQASARRVADQMEIEA